MKASIFTSVSDQPSSSSSASSSTPQASSVAHPTSDLQFSFRRPTTHYIGDDNDEDYDEYIPDDDDHPTTTHDTSRSSAAPQTRSSASGFTASGVRRSIFMTLLTLGMTTSTHHEYNSTVDFTHMFTVQGQYVHGVIVDPGAATSLSGTETIRRYVDDVLTPQGYSIRIYPTEATFTGVDGITKPGLGRCVLPLLLTGSVDVTWTTNLLGDEGSTCPCLLANDTILFYNGTVYTNILPNKDGILSLVLQKPNGRQASFFFRLLLTDSGHYILPIDGRRRVNARKEHEELKKAVQRRTLQMTTTVSPEKEQLTLLLENNESTPRTGIGIGTTSTSTKTVHFQDKEEEILPTPSPKILDNNLTTIPTTSTRTDTSNDWMTCFANHHDDALAKAWKTVTGSPYTDDLFPKTFTDEDYKVHASKYKNIPEEFYTFSGLPVITPENAQDWIDKVSKVVKDLHFQEFMSGSGRLSWGAYCSGLKVAFPVDFRYSWDLRNKKHQNLLEQVQTFIDYYSPSCSAWTSITGLWTQDLRDARRNDEVDTLDWIRQRIIKKYSSNETSSIVENPQRSSIFDKSPLKGLLGHSKAKRKVVDQCQLGAIQQHTGLPARKSTILLLLGILLHTNPPRCTGENKCEQHAELLHDGAGEFAVYPWKLVTFLIKTFQNHLKTPVTTWFLDFWSCAKCKFGSKTTEPHTYDRNCRLGPREPPDTTTPGAASSSSSTPTSPSTTSRPLDTDDSTSTRPSTDVPAPPAPHSAPRRRYLKKQPPTTSDDDPTFVDQPTYIEPSFDIRLLKKQLNDPNVSKKEKIAGLLGLHIKFWHASLSDMSRMLYRGGHGKDVLDLLPEVLKRCKECQERARTMSKPLIKASLATHFNDRVQTDLFFLWDRCYVIMVDECIRYCIAARMENKTALEWLQVVFDTWIRYFGPMNTITSDQEGAVTSDLVAIACEKFNINRDLGGSYGHTAAPIAERRIEIVKLGSLKLWSTVQRTGLTVDQDRCVSEIAMSTNLLLSYGGATPVQGLLGHQPKELYDPENRSLSSVTGALTSTPDYIETAIRLRLHAKDCILQSIVEDRLARADNTRIQQYKPEDMAKLKDGSEIDLWKEPEGKDIPGWRGPAELVKLYTEKAIIVWKGHPMMVPIRHIKPHVNFLQASQFLASADQTKEDVVMKLLEAIDFGPFGTVIMYGRVYSESDQGYVFVPPDLERNPPYIYRLARDVASALLSWSGFDGIQFGTQTKRTTVVIGASRGILVTWNRTDRSQYNIQDVKPTSTISLDFDHLHWKHRSYIMYYDYSSTTTTDDDKPTDITDVSDSKPSDHDHHPELDDSIISSIPWSPSPWTSYGGSWLDLIHDDDEPKDMSLTTPKASIIIDRPSGPPPQGPSGPPVKVTPDATMNTPSIDDTTMNRTNSNIIVDSSSSSQPPPQPPQPPIPQNRSQSSIIHPDDDSMNSLPPLVPIEPLSPPPGLQHPSSHHDLDRSRSRVKSPSPSTPSDPNSTGTNPQEIIQPLPNPPEIEPNSASAAAPLLPITEKDHDHDTDRSRSRDYINKEQSNNTSTSSEPIPPTTPTTGPILPTLDQDTTTPNTDLTRPREYNDNLETDQEHADKRQRTEEQTPDADQTLPYPEPSSTPSVEQPNDNQDDTQRTLEYSDNDLDSTRTYLATNGHMPEMTLLDHAIADAELVLLNYRLDEAGTLPWTPSESFLVIPGPFRNSRCFYYDFKDDECFSVSSDDILTQQDLIDYWYLVDEADRKEIASFVEHTVFKLSLRYGSNVTNVIDAIWVRRWKGGQIKCRLCGRGYLDRQKTFIDRHSSTASRLSHRLAVSQAVQHDLDMECIDISTAFLQGLKFSEIVSRAKQLGHEPRKTRRVWLIPPANVWRHLRNIVGSKINVQDVDSCLFILELLKAMYGLVDGPLLFQLALLDFLCNNLHMQRSMHDDNYLYLSYNWTLVAVFVVHVDDILMCAQTWFLKEAQQALEKRFGKLKRNKLPFTYLGVEHVRHSPTHIALYQHEYLSKLKPIPIMDKRRPDQEPLSSSDNTAFRSLLCSLLWLCLTRLDLISSVLLLQQEMVRPVFSHLKEVNSLLKRAFHDQTNNGLHFHRLPFPLRSVGISDAGHATRRSTYAQEGRMVLIMHDSQKAQTQEEWILGKEASYLGGHGHPLFFGGKKATRVSHSTSHSEALSFSGTTQIAQLVAQRMTEPFAKDILRIDILKPSHLIELQNSARTIIPVDHITDCMDVFELVTGHKGIPADKTQRIIIMSLREDRLKRHIRTLYHYPTVAMLADALTKQGFFPQFLCYCTTGFVRLPFKNDQYIRARTGPPRGRDVSEHDLTDMKP